MSFQNLWGGVIGFAPKLIIALIIFIIGLFVASIIGRFVDKDDKSSLEWTAPSSPLAWTRC